MAVNRGFKLQKDRETAYLSASQVVLRLTTPTAGLNSRNHRKLLRNRKATASVCMASPAPMQTARKGPLTFQTEQATCHRTIQPAMPPACAPHQASLASAQAHGCCLMPLSGEHVHRQHISPVIKPPSHQATKPQFHQPTHMFP